MKGRPRLAAVIALARGVPLPDDPVVVDVGADHGHVARALRGIASERLPGRIARPEGRWVVADGLRPYRRVDLAVVAGMGAATILGILDAGPRPAALVVHAQDDPPSLRLGLAARGWRIEAEALAPEAGRHAEIVRAVPGDEPARGLDLAYGPALRREGHPLLGAHLAQLLGWLDGLLREAAGRAPEREAGWRARRDHVEAWLKSL